MLTFSIHTLGCRLNQADSATVAGDLTAHGYQSVPWGEPSDIVIINSCAVTGIASQKSRQAVRAVRKRLPDAFVVLMGCEATVADAEKYPEVDLIVPNPKPAPLSKLLGDKLIRQQKPLFPAPGRGRTSRSRRAVISSARTASSRTRAAPPVPEICMIFCAKLPN